MLCFESAASGRKLAQGAAYAFAVAALGEKSPAALQRIMETAMRLSVLDVEDAKKA